MFRKLPFMTLFVFAVATFPAQAAFRAKLVLEDGGEIRGTPQVIPQLNQRLVPGCSVSASRDGTIEYTVDDRTIENQLHPLSRGKTADQCDVSIIVKGYRPVHATLRDKAVIVLKRIGEHEGSTVSLTALNAPKDAKKSYEQGLAALSDRKWDAAQKDFEKAVAIYPQYSPAWSGLGDALVPQSKLPEARAAWEHAVQADPKYIKPYLLLTKMAIVENRNQDASDIAEHALAQNPVEFPAIYFYYAVAQHGLGHQDIAEKFAARAIELDTEHEYPRAEFLLGTLLSARGDRAGAIQHLNKYLAAAPKAVDADAVRKRVADLEQNAATAN
jgi:tetratricopeptide (TPR) repeat protein